MTIALTYTPLVSAMIVEAIATFLTPSAKKIAETKIAVLTQLGINVIKKAIASFNLWQIHPEAYHCDNFFFFDSTAHSVEVFRICGYVHF